jgi:hypothetical protein
MLATLPYLHSFLASVPGEMDLRLADVRWDERFPARPIEIDGHSLQAVQLQTGDEEVWLVVPPAVWQRITHIAQQVIEREQQLRQALRREAEPDTSTSQVA